ncbi:C40 family peptidase [Pacificibacter marinus]|uniref:Dipeptidyl-peptidase 6 n=1 Tax=Pacificibacter marinus TaxID=658057 RepID=A0A1Y5S2P6_9RHOB|nr:NlpC/P60 family protein [Pacificibacter marinus]SEK92176.1 NlpC/P60 family protein [Pacificibacter marinus]SLN31310.1 Dipeptidyl-peptidase 6 [Pacificibacter marinus]
MNDPRLIPANMRVALAGFAAQGQAEVVPTPVSVSKPVADLRIAPNGARTRQLVMGEMFDVIERDQGWAFGRAARDGYVGYIAEGDLGFAFEATHFISARASHLYPKDDFKSEARASLPFGARLRVIDERRKFVETDTGQFIPKAHVRLIDRPFSDPVTVAQLFFGTPYLWGGNSSFGIDCSGLVQAGLLACQMPCPGDSDQQMALGADANGGYKRGDVVFWQGHVALCVDDETLIHANAHHMAVAYEPIGKAIARIEAQGDGCVTAHRRI